jgi:ribose transport system ATP-binding protein/rhamnose transport system ATP-binding protein
VTVLRDGGLSESGPISDYDEDRLITAMVGREISSLYPESHRHAGTPVLRVRGLRRSENSPSIDFDVGAGEILGIGGLLGSGRSELLLSIFGADPIAAGELEIEGRPVKPRGPRAMMNAGVGLLTEDRKVLGLLPELSIRENVTIASLRSGSRRGLLPGREQSEEADRLLDSLRLRAGSYDQPVSTLSGGNQQKVLLARWLLTKPKILIFDEPTKGIDVGAKGELYTVIGDLAAKGLGIIVVSSYLPELLGLSDRILVLRDGEVSGELPGTASEEDVLRLASGGRGAEIPDPRQESPPSSDGTGAGLPPVFGGAESEKPPARRAGGTSAPGPAETETPPTPDDPGEVNRDG